MALPPTTANWHWKNKNVTRWAKEWFEKELTNLCVTGDKEGEIVTISKVSEVDGDAELGQRKSKLITIFDCNLTLEWEGTASDGIAVKGRLHLPEVSHEITVDNLSDYTYDWTTTSTERSPAVEALLVIAKTRLPPLLETTFAKFPVDLIEVHGKDLTVSADPSRSGTPAPSAPTAAAAAGANSSAAPAANAASASETKPEEKKKKAINATTVKAEASFMASADGLFGLLTDEKRIPLWSRAAAKSNATPDSEYFLFGGGVKGKYVSLTRPTEIVQTWALQSPTWPSDHEGILTTTLEQSSDSTKIKFSLSGVPTGLEDEIRRNIEGYYIHGMKSIGYVQIFPSPPPVYTEQYLADQERKRSAAQNNLNAGLGRPGSYAAVIVITTLVLVAAFSVPFLSSPRSPAA